MHAADGMDAELPMLLDVRPGVGIGRLTLPIVSSVKMSASITSALTVSCERRRFAYAGLGQSV